MDFLFKNKKKEESETSDLKTISQIKGESSSSQSSQTSNSSPASSPLETPPDMNVEEQNYQNPFTQDSSKEEDINPFEESKPNNSNTQSSQLPTDNTPKKEDSPIENIQSSTQINIEEKIEEIVEKVLESKWEEFTQSVQNIIDWKDSIDLKLKDIDGSFEFLKSEFSTFQKKMLTKLESYDTNILDVNAELKAFEKVFSKITPVFVNNIEELKGVVKDLKEVKDIKKE